MTQVLATLREWAHHLLAPLGIVLVAPGVAGDVATFFNAHVNGLGQLNTATIVGFIFTAVSKFIDSGNNALTTPSPSITVATSSVGPPADTAPPAPVVAAQG